MTDRPHEVTEVHSRLLKCALEVEDARAYWEHARGRPSADVTPRRGFDEYWFGARSLARIDVLVANFRARFDAFPPSLDVLHRWTDMPPDTRRVVCHWHLQLADPLYRVFTGTFLPERRGRPRPEVTRDVVVAWVGREGPARWTMATRIQCASKLLSAAYAAGLVATNRDPRPLVLPRVNDEALEYLLYLLRDVAFAGTLLANPYAASVGLESTSLEDRLRGLRGLSFSARAISWTSAGSSTASPACLALASVQPRPP
jgi:hypothetical protein